MSTFQPWRFKSLVGPIFERIKNDSDQLALIFVHDDESEEKISVGQLHAGACAYAHGLEEMGIRAGDIVILALRHSKALIYAFWGTIYTGAVPTIFAYKGPMTTAAAYIARLKDMVYHSGTRLVITLPELEIELRKSLAETDCRVTTFGEEVDETIDSPPVLNWPATGGEEIAYLQYTSGTTGMQKGVELSHRAILNFIFAAFTAMEIGSSDVIVNWLPLYHDFGLFAGLILPLFSAVPSILISPFKWLRKPQVLLKAIQNHRGTISFLPNSGHHHTLRCMNDEEFHDLDLSSLRLLVNGSEPVLYETQDTFLERFAPYGLRESALVCGYGMAENTLAITFSKVGQRSPVDWISIKEMQTSRRAVPASPHKEGSKANVSSGVPLTGVELAVIAENGRRLPERGIGEIIVRSNFLFRGYHKRPDLTNQVIHDGWYHSGDLGYLADGEVYVCGRKKDLIIVGGHNIHPEDLEAAASKVPGIQEDRVVAIGVLDENLGTDKIVLICGLTHPVSEEEKVDIERELRQRIYAELEVTPGEVHLVKKNWVVKTHNGKIARGLNRQKYMKELGGL